MVNLGTLYLDFSPSSIDELSELLHRTKLELCNSYLQNENLPVSVQLGSTLHLLPLGFCTKTDEHRLPCLYNWRLLTSDFFVVADLHYSLPQLKHATAKHEVLKDSHALHLWLSLKSQDLHYRVVP